MYKIVAFIYFFQPLFIFGVTENPYEYQPCTTPNHLSGLCIFLLECPIIYEHQQKDVLYRDDLQFLYRSQCGYFDKRIMVCCPDISIEGQVEILSKSTIVVEKPKQIKGLDLLPEPGICGSGSIPIRRRKRDRTRIFNHPWTVLLEYLKSDNSKKFHCSGTLINQRYVLTSSDCVSGEFVKSHNLTLTSVRMRDWNLDEKHECLDDLCSPEPIDVDVEEVIFYNHSFLPNTNESVNNKLALLRLVKEIKYSDGVKPLCLPFGEKFDGNFYANHDNTLTISGWKKVNENNGFKVQANVRRANLQKCHQQNPRRPNCISSRMVSDIECRNYIGSPVMLRSIGSTINQKRSRTSWYLVGILSHASCDGDNWTGSYIEVTDYNGWILNEIKS